MRREVRPLFRPDVLADALRGYTPPPLEDEPRRKLRAWAEKIRTGEIDAQNERKLLPDFLTDIFEGLLGYRGFAETEDAQTISKEQLVEVDGKFADAVLGRFDAGGKPAPAVVAVEGKGPKDPLDRAHGGRKLSAVQQAYEYAINLECDWIVVTSFKEIRLYCKRTDQRTYESFDLVRLDANEATLKRFRFLLGADRVVGTPVCHLETLREESDRVGKEVTKDFYVRYADVRQDLYETLAASNPDEDRGRLLSAAQTILDRVLFIAFCEDRGLMRAESLKSAHEYRDPYSPRPVWDNFRALFEAVNEGNDRLGIKAYNGGLFKHDPWLDGLTVPDAVCDHFKTIGDYNFRDTTAPDAVETLPDPPKPLVDVDVLGHIFEQSIADLEKLRARIADRESAGRKPLANERTRRRKEGAFYTPAFVTRYMTEQTLGVVLRERFEDLRTRHSDASRGAGRQALADPRVYTLGELSKTAKAKLIAFWEAWQDELTTVRVLDPACGSGAFLIAAFDFLTRAFEESNARLDELRGYRTTTDLNRQILQDCLYGVDLNDEAVEICRLSLWIKTATVGEVLTSLDHTIRVGNSVVDDPEFAGEKAFDWKAAFPEVFGDDGPGGFDIVVGNPPYVRQELIRPFKPYFKDRYRVYHGSADLYAYFYELALRLTRPGGLMSLIVTNKWMRAGYGGPLRKFLGEQSALRSIVDFGHAKQIFPDADVFPCVLVAAKPGGERGDEHYASVCVIPRDELRVDDLSEQVAERGHRLSRSEFEEQGWSLDPAAGKRLLERLSDLASLRDRVDAEPLFGIKTGLNEAFLVDDETAMSLVERDRDAALLVRRSVVGRDIDRWHAAWAGRSMITIASSRNRDWPWSDAENEESAERIFASTYPTLHAHLKPFEASLKKRQDRGVYWWELRSCAYWGALSKPKIFYQDIMWQPSFAIDRDGLACNNSVYFLPTDDEWIVSVLNSSVGWWYAWRKAVHGKDEALRYFTEFLVDFPIPDAGESSAEAESLVRKLSGRTAARSEAVQSLIALLALEYEVIKPTERLSEPDRLREPDFLAEVRKSRRKTTKQKLSAAAIKALRDEYAATVVPMRKLAEEIFELECRLDDLVTEAYGLTDEEVALMWRTAPPRMPLPPPWDRGRFSSRPTPSGHGRPAESA